MTEINFYHLTVRPLEWALPKLLERTMQSGERAVVRVSSAERLEALDRHLWTYDPASWLPHGSAKDGAAVDQPIWLTLDDENPNGARFLFLADSAVSDHVADFERVFELFDGRDAEAVRGARSRWRSYRDAGHALSYWRQTPNGRWEKGA